MPKTVFSGENEALVTVLREARRRSRLTQAELAARIGKDQSFVSLVEGSQRRVDVIEFCALARAMGEEPEALFARLVQKLPRQIKI
jgi:transcriptional regulator with XRE-family HTH domain